MNKNTDNQHPKMNQQDEPNQDFLRLNQYIANAGICNRREADHLIKKGMIKVNGVIVNSLGIKVKKSDRVEYQGHRITPEQRVYLLMNKPRNIALTSKDPDKNIFDIIDDELDEHVFPVGRFEKENSGLLFLTNDGEIASKLIDPNTKVKQIYHATTDKPIIQEHIEALMKGIELGGECIQVDQASYVVGEDQCHVGIELSYNKTPIVKQLLEHLGYKVIRLDRVYFAGLTKRNLKRGWFRYLTTGEVNLLKMGNFK